MNVYVVGIENALQVLLDGQEALKLELAEIRRVVMALTTQETAALQGISDRLDKLQTDIDTAWAAATTVNSTLRQQIAALEAQGTADAATIAGLKATADQMEQDVLGALGGVQDHVTAVDDHLQAIQPNPPTP